MIHYHGTPISGDEKSQLALTGKHAMVSYASPNYIELIAEICQSIAIDNGAFSTWKTGKPFDIEGYAEFVSEWAMHPACDWYVIPDVIDGNAEENEAIRTRWANFVAPHIKNKGIPVWHLNEPIEVLQYLIAGYSTVAFGSAGDYSVVGDAKWWERMTEALEVCTDDQGRPKCHLHGLRMLDPDVFSHIPLKSADSTNVARNAGIDSRWIGPYAPRSRRMRALLMMERIESHASARRWNPVNFPRNWELFG